MPLLPSFETADLDMSAYFPSNAALFVDDEQPNGLGFANFAPELAADFPVDPAVYANEQLIGDGQIAGVNYNLFAHQAEEAAFPAHLPDSLSPDLNLDYTLDFGLGLHSADPIAAPPPAASPSDSLRNRKQERGASAAVYGSTIARDQVRPEMMEFVSPTKGGAMRINRPPNAWLLYLADKTREARAAGAANETSGVGCIGRTSVPLAARWKNESEAVRREYFRRADGKAEQHRVLFPQYKFTRRKQR